jgi:TolA-binding protein
MIAAGFHMTLWIRRGVVVLVLLAGVSVYALQQQGSGRGGRRGGADDEEDVILPNGKSQKEEILKAEHQQNLKDAAELADLAEQLKMELEKNDRYILSMATLKKTDDIEKLAKRIRARLRHN